MAALCIGAPVDESVAEAPSEEELCLGYPQEASVARGDLERVFRPAQEGFGCSSACDDVLLSRLEALELQMSRLLAECVGERVEELERRVDFLSSQVPSPRNLVFDDPVAVSPPAYSPDTGTSSGQVSRTLSGKTAADKVSQVAERTYFLRESTWDLCLLIDMEGVSPMSSLLGVAMYVVNLAIQVLFCIRLPLLVDVNKFDETAQREALTWRLQSGHTALYMDEASQTSLLARICRGQFYADGTAENQIGMLQSVLAFMSVTETGPAGRTSLLCLVCVLCWTSTIVTEVQQAFQFSRAVLGLHADTTHFEPGEGHALGLSCVRVAALLLGVVLPRLALAAVVGFFGMEFIVYSDSPVDMVLNAIALSFILSIDELLYEPLCPWELRRLMGLEIPLAHFPLGRFGFVRQLAKWLVLATILSSAYVVQVSLVIPLFEQMHSYERVLCGGDLDFVCAVERGSNVQMCANTSNIWHDAIVKAQHLPNFFNYGRLHATGLPVAKPRVEVAVMPALGAYNVSEAIFWDTWDTISKRLTSNAKEFAYDIPSCLDGQPVMSPQYLGAFNAAVLAGEVPLTRPRAPNVTGVACETLAQADCYVDSPWRAFCPRFCGCHDPLSGIAITSGCPTRCKMVRKLISNRATQESGCTDRNLTELNQMEGWSRYWAELDALPNALYSRDLSLVSVSARQLGCNVLNTTNVILRQLARLFCSELELGESVIGSIEIFCPGSCAMKLCR